MTIEVEDTDPSTTPQDGEGRTESPSNLSKKGKGVTFGEEKPSPKGSALEKYSSKV